ncbi:hypothetical protein [Streptomyces fagopyri]|uniref:hypothetical protein n=1 Tax=Streptomyces fagopyri TaxID=2662397 RepID=UPI003713D046
MGSKPSTAASTAATMQTTSDVDVISGNGQFGVPHAFVITVCIATAAILAPSGMSIRDVLFLIAGASGIGAAVVVTVMTGGRGASGRIGRFMKAYFTSKN